MNPHQDCRLVRLEEVDSTQLEARRRFSVLGHDRHALVVTAAVQSAAFGRMGRSWTSPPGGLWLTLARPLARAPADYADAPIIAGFAAADAIADVCGLRATIKPPNDLLLRGRKVAGVLCNIELTPAPPFLLVGVGINANFALDALGGELRGSATTLLAELGRPVDLDRLGEALVDQLTARLDTVDRRRPLACRADPAANRTPPL